MRTDIANLTYPVPRGNTVIIHPPEHDVINLALKDLYTFHNDDGSHPQWTIAKTNGLQDALDSKAIDSTVVHLAGSEVISGAKTFSAPVVVPAPAANNNPTTKIYVDTALAGKINVGDAVTITGAQTITGAKTFSVAPVVPDDSWTIAKTSGLQAALDLKANDSSVVHLAGTETIAGAKTFSISPLVPAPTADGHAATKLYVDSSITAGATPDATSTVKGKLRLTNDLGGTADAPTTPTAVHLAGAETISGSKTFSVQTSLAGALVTAGASLALQNAAANANGSIRNAGATGIANLTLVAANGIDLQGPTIVTPAGISQVPLISRGMASQTGDLQQWQNSAGAVLARVTVSGEFQFGTSPLAVDNTVVHLAGTETVTGTKLFSATTTSFGATDNVAQVVVWSQSATRRALVVRSAASATASLQEWQNSAGTVIGLVAPDGRWAIGNASQPFTPVAWLDVRTASASIVPLSLRGAASQTANLTEWQDSAGVALLSVNASGVLYGGTGAVLVSSNGTATTFGFGGHSGYPAFYVSGVMVAKAGSSGSQTCGLYVEPALAADRGLIVRGKAAQAQNLLQIENNSGTTLVSVGQSGNLSVIGTTDVIQGLFKGSGTQSVNVLEVQSSASVKRFGVSPTGITYSNGLTVGGEVGVNLATGTAFFWASNSGATSIVARAFTTPTANIQEWQLNNSTVVASVSSSGRFQQALNGASYGVADVSALKLQSHTVTLTGADPTTYGTFYASQIGAMTLTGTNPNQNVTIAAGLHLTPPVKGTNVNLTESYGLLIPAQAVGAATRSYGLSVTAPTGATNNTTAIFLGGNVGIGTTLPLGGRLEIVNAATDTIPMLSLNHISTRAGGNVYGQQIILTGNSGAGGTTGFYGIQSAVSSGAGQHDSNVLSAGQFSINHSGSGTVTNPWGFESVVSNSGTATFSNAVIVRARASNASTGIITNLQAFRAIAPTKGTGSIGTYHGVYVESAPDPTNSYAAYFGGRVGIGRVAPVSMLDVEHAAAAGAVGDAMRLRHPSAAASGNGSALTFGDASQNYASIWAVSTAADSTTAELRFRAGTNAYTGTAQMTLTTAGNLGIGIVSTAHRLYVSATDRAARFDGGVGIGTDSPTTSALHVLAGSASTVPLTAQGAASQTANLTEWKNSAGSVLASVSSIGDMTVSRLRTTTWQNSADGNTIFGLAGGILTFGNAASALQLLVLGRAAATVPLVVQGVAGQTADLLKVQDSATVDLLRVTSAGHVYIRGGRPWADVRAFGATGDGVTNDRAAIQAAIDAVNTLGGGTVFFPQGTYAMNMVDHPENNTYRTCLRIYSNVLLRGAGNTASVLFLLANQSTTNSAEPPVTVSGVNTAVVMNNNLAAGNNRPKVQDLGIDGNGANQTLTSNGIFLLRCASPRLTRVRVIDARGTSAGGDANETSLIHFNTCSDPVADNCEAERTAGETSIGMTAQNCTGARFVNCFVRGMTKSHGFGHNASRDTTYVGCTAVKIGGSGTNVQAFNFEVGERVTCVGCVAGGRAAATATQPYTANEDLGCTGSGFTANQVTDVTLDGCMSSYNDGGVTFVQGATGRIVGGTYSFNRLGVNVSTDSDAGLLQVDKSVLIHDNTEWNVVYGSLSFSQHGVADLSIPLTTVPFVNPYPWAITIYLIGGTVTDVLLEGASVGIRDTYVLEAGGTMRIDYTTPPFVRGVW